MEVKLGDKFLRVWDDEYVEGIVVVNELDLNKKQFSAFDKNSGFWWYEESSLRAYYDTTLLSILTPLNSLSKLLYLGE